MSTVVKTVDKSDIKTLNFFKSDVLFNNIEKNKRMLSLEKACTMGNSWEESKARIVFACEDGIKKVEARIVAISKSSVKLKGLTTMPIKSIIGVDLIQ